MSTVGLRSTFREIFSGILNVVSTVSPRSKTVSVENPEAYAQWGDESEFAYDGNAYGYNITEPYDPLQGDLYEEGCKYSDIRVENPEDTSQKVIVRRYEAIAFTARMKPTHPAQQSNPHPQVVMSFSNFDGGASYKAAAGRSFSPIALDPFNTIIEVSWATKDALLLAYTIAPAEGGEVWGEFSDPDLNSYNEGGKGIITKMDSGNFSKPRELQVGLYHTAKKIAPDMTYSGSYTYPQFTNMFPNVSRVYVTETKTYDIFKGSTDTQFAILRGGYENPANSSPPVTDPAAIWSDPQVQLHLRESLGLEALGADGTYANTPESPASWWRVNAFVTQHIRVVDPPMYSEDRFYVYDLWHAPWTHYYDPSPYIYGCLYIDVPMLLRAMDTLYPGWNTESQNRDVEVIFNSLITLDSSNSGDPYSGNSHLRAMWFATSTADADKLSSMTINKQGVTYIEQSQILDMYQTGSGMSSEVPDDMASALKTVQDFDLVPGSAMKEAPYERKRLTLNFTDRSLS